MSDWKGFKHRIKTDGNYDAVDNKDPSSTGIIVHDRVADPTKDDQNLNPTGVSSGDDNRHCIDVALSDGDGFGIDEENPLPTYLTESPGDEVDEYDSGTDTAEDATVNHDYVVSAGKTLKGLKVSCMSTGFSVFKLQIETGVGTGVFSTTMVKSGSVSDSNVELSYNKRVAAGVTIRVAKTNCDDDDTDLHSTIQGVEV